MVRAVCGWGSREEVKIEVEEMKGKKKLGLKQSR